MDDLELDAILDDLDIPKASQDKKTTKAKAKKPTVSKVSRGEGNTKPPPDLPSRTRSRKYCFTINNYSSIEYKKTIDYCLKNSLYYIVGKETGEQGTHHLQGYVEYKNQCSFSSIKQGLPRAHIEKAKGSKEQNWKYCSKDGDYVSNYDCLTFQERIKKRILDEYKTVVWKDWQKEILDLLATPPNSRSIHWFVDTEGNKGKSFLCKYIALTNDVIICDGKKTDIFNEVKTSMDKEKEPRIIICDVPRTSISFLNYGVIEKLKDGLVYSGKYEGGTLIFGNPHVIIFANEYPDESTMSADRWVIKEL